MRPKFTKAIKKVGEDIENMKFNTAIATLMSLVNTFTDNKPTKGDIKALILMLSPFAPHVADELWELQGYKGYASLQPWPKYDRSKNDLTRKRKLPFRLAASRILRL